MVNENKYVIAVRHPEPYLPSDLRKKRKKTSIRRRWNNLPEDLVGEIMVRLSSADRIRLAASCKKFRSLMPNYNHGEINQFPWLVKLCFRHSNNQSYLFKLYDPIHHTPYSVTYVREITTGQERVSGDRMRLLCSRKGWLLLGGRKQQILEGEEGKLTRVSTSLVLVSPFTKQIITLPDLDHSPFTFDQLCMPWMVASYSCDDPSSPDCVYFVLWVTRAYGYVNRISTLRNGDTEWKTTQFGLSSVVSVIFHEGNFYAVSTEGHIAAYSVVENKCGFLTGPKPSKRHWNCDRYPYLLVCEGKLLLVFLDLPFFKEYDQEERCIVFEHVQKEDWVEKTSLGDNVVFLSRHGSFSVSTLSAGVANRIYNVRRGGLKKKYYSLEDGKAHLCDSSCWPGVERRVT